MRKTGASIAIKTPVKESEIKSENGEQHVK